MVVVVSLLAIVSGGLYAVSSDSATAASNSLVDQSHASAPNFSVSSVRDPAKSISLSDFRGKDVVVNFWASWCDPCRTEMSLLESASVSERQKVRFVGIDTNDTRSEALSFLRRVHVTYPAGFDPNGHAASAYGLYGLPVTVFISASGKMVGRHLGQLDAATLHTALQKAFGGGY